MTMSTRTRRIGALLAIVGFGTFAGCAGQETGRVDSIQTTYSRGRPVTVMVLVPDDGSPRRRVAYVRNCHRGSLYIKDEKGLRCRT